MKFSRFPPKVATNVTNKSTAVDLFVTFRHGHPN